MEIESGESMPSSKRCRRFVAGDARDSTTSLINSLSFHDLRLQL
jgi:hypothetical protein